MGQPAYTLVIGDKMTSSWSLRPWLVMRHFAIAFDEEHVRLRQPGTQAAIAAISPSGKVPVLRCGAMTVWDSLAIIETLADAHPDIAIWPRDKSARGHARAICNEMHAGFAALRQNCPMDFCARGLTPLDGAAIAADVARVCQIWVTCRSAVPRADGPFLFGAFTAADAMFAPVVSRFVSYDIATRTAADPDDLASAYVAAVSALPDMVRWGVEAAAEAQGRDA